MEFLLMVWPSAKTPQGLRCVRTLDRTILGSFYLGEVQVIDLWRRSPAKIIAKLQKLDYYKSLPKDVLVKYSNASFDTVKRIIFLWRSIEANILTANPGLIGKPLTLLHKRLWHWCITGAIHSYHGFMTQYKRLTLHLLHYSNKVLPDSQNAAPCGVPGVKRGALGPLWFEMIPALKHIALAKVLGDLGKVPDAAFKSVAYLIQRRSAPPPPLTDARFEEEVESMRKEFLQRIDFSESQMHETAAAMLRMGNFIEKANANPRPHISLSANGGYQASRNGGGKGMNIAKQFMARYVHRTADSDFEGKTIWGAPLTLKKGVRPYRTICRHQELRDDIPFLRSAFRDEWAPGGLLKAVCSEQSSHCSLEGPVLGLDESLPHQLLQLAHEEIVAHGWLQGPAYHTLERNKVLFRPAPVPTELILQSENGDKVRGLSKPPSFVTLFLQPFAHFLAGLAKVVPSLKSAFTRSYKGWDLAVMLSRRTDNYIEPFSGLSAIDLTGSTNGIDWEFIKNLVKPLIGRFSKSVYELAYLEQALALLISPRRMEVRRRPSDTDHRIIMTETGVHMGDPGAKEILCIMNAAIELMVYRDVPRLPPTLIAGDDIGAVRTHQRHSAIIAKHQNYGNDINADKAQFSYYFIWFCEEVLRYRGATINSGLPPWKVTTDKIHLDVVKMRLLSPFASTGDFDLKRNPAFGKGNALYDQLLNIKEEEKERSDFLLHTFNNWMSSFLRDDPWVYMPRAVGGCNVPWPHSWNELYERIKAECHPYAMKLYAALKNASGEPPLLLHVLTRKMSSGASARGIIDPMNLEGIVQTAMIAGLQFQDKSKTLDWFLADIQSKRDYECSFKDALHHARVSGYVSFGNIAENLDRVTTMRLLFAYASGAMGDSSGFVEAAHERVPLPGEILTEFIEEIENCKRLVGATPADLTLTSDDVDQFRKWVLQGAPNFVAAMSQSWIPKEALVDSMNGMTIHMPPKLRIIIPGSVNDPHIDIQMGPAAETISRQRQRLR
jgi:hypothetical protein